MSASHHKRAVGQNLRLVREALGLSQKQLADKYDLGDKSKVSHWERGLSYPDPWFVFRLWQEEGITADWIYLASPRGLPAWLADGLRAAAAALQGAETAAGTKEN